VESADDGFLSRQVRRLAGEFGGDDVEPRSVCSTTRDYLTAHPGDGGGARYTWSDTGLDADAVREQVSAYQDRFGVPTEALK
jgi:hypothetical protein